MFGKDTFRMQDEISQWRSDNAAQILERAKRKYADVGIDANPRLVYLTLDHGSWHDQAEVQDLWAGLLASSCSRDARDEANLIFVNTLSQMTLNEIRLWDHACTVTEKHASPGGLIVASPLHCGLDELQRISGINDIHRLDRELDHLRTLGLFPFGFSAEDSTLVADITPGSLALHMYARCRGFAGSPLDFFNSARVPPDAMSL